MFRALASPARSWALLLTLAIGSSACDRREAPTRPPPAVATPAYAAAPGLAGDALGEQPATRRPAELEARQPDQVSTEDRDDYGVAMIEGDAALYSGRFDGARAHYLHALELRPDKTSPALGALRTMVLQGHGEERAALARQIQRKIERYEASPDTAGAGYLLSARLAIALQRPGEALDKARLAVEKLPDLGVAWRILGEAAVVAERWGQAVQAFRKAANLGLAAKAGTWERMADALDELGDVAAAEQAARQAMALTGTDPHARRRRLNLLAAILEHRGDFDGAAATLEQARALGADDPAVLHNLASLAERRGETDAALALYLETLQGDEPMPSSSWRLAHLLLRIDRRKEALQAFTAAAAHIDRWVWPRSTRWWPAYEIGKLYARAGHQKEAVGWFEDALRLARTGDSIREVRSWLSFSQVRTGAPD